MLSLANVIDHRILWNSGTRVGDEELVVDKARVPAVAKVLEVDVSVVEGAQRRIWSLGYELAEEISGIKNLDSRQILPKPNHHGSLAEGRGSLQLTSSY